MVGNARGDGKKVVLLAASWVLFKKVLRLYLPFFSAPLHLFKVITRISSRCSWQLQWQEADNSKALTETQWNKHAAKLQPTFMSR